MEQLEITGLILQLLFQVLQQLLSLAARQVLEIWQDLVQLDKAEDLVVVVVQMAR
jgi:hypothetical protein